MMNSEASLKESVINQGYVPETCTLPGVIIWGLMSSDKDPCDGCTQLRSVCNGRQKGENKSEVS